MRRAKTIYVRVADRVLSLKIAFRSTGAEPNEKNTDNAPFDNIPNVHNWTEGRINVQKRPFETFALDGAFSCSRASLVNNSDSRKAQTGFQINSPRIKKAGT